VDALSSPWLALLVIAALMAFAYLILGVGDAIAERRKYGKAAKQARAYKQKRSRTRSHLPAVLLLGAVACLVVAFAQFQTRTETAEAIVVITLDVSDSMDKEDVEPDRMTAATVAARAFLDQVPEGFRVGLVTFAGEPTVVVSPTEDRTEVELALLELPRGRGTVIGDGLATAVEAIEADREANGNDPAAIVLLSDGRDRGSVVQPLEAATMAANEGLAVYTVVLGATEGESGADAALLEQLASTTDGTSSTAETSSELTGVFESLGSELTTTLSIGGTGPAFIVLGALLATGAGGLVIWSARKERLTADKKKGVRSPTRVR
jgi:Ca-activated chloride channel family protein